MKVWIDEVADRLQGVRERMEDVWPEPHGYTPRENHVRRVRFGDILAARHRTRSARRHVGIRTAKRELDIPPGFRDYGLDAHGLPFVEFFHVSGDGRWPGGTHVIVSEIGHPLHVEQKYPPNHAARAHDIQRVFPPAPLSGTPAKLRAALAAGDRGTCARPLTDEQRAERYQRQNRGGPVTARQAHRANKKMRQAEFREAGV
jgi:hypothetical protein